MKTNKLRQYYRHIRQSLSPEHQNRNAVLLKQNINAVIDSSNPLKIAAYHAVQGEISLEPWISDNSRHHVYLPKLHEVINPELRFAPLTQDTQWEKNRFNIAEPDVKLDECLAAQELDIILMPLVSFDRKGHRLGMGGGYYDRSLAFKLSPQKSSKPRLIGVAHSCQEYTQLAPQSWDVPLDTIITENEIIIPYDFYLNP